MSQLSSVQRCTRRALRGVVPPEPVRFGGVSAESLTRGAFRCRALCPRRNHAAPIRGEIKPHGDDSLFESNTLTAGWGRAHSPSLSRGQHDAFGDCASFLRDVRVRMDAHLGGLAKGRGMKVLALLFARLGNLGRDSEHLGEGVLADAGNQP